MPKGVSMLESSLQRAPEHYTEKHGEWCHTLVLLGALEEEHILCAVTWGYQQQAKR